MSYEAGLSLAGTHISNLPTNGSIYTNLPYKVSQILSYENTIYSNMVWGSSYTTKIYVVDTPQNLYAGLSGYLLGGGSYFNLRNVQPLLGFYYSGVGYKFQPVVAKDSIASIDTWYSLWSYGASQNVTAYNKSTASSGAYAVNLASNQYIYDTASNYSSKSNYLNYLTSWFGSSATYELVDSQVSASQLSAFSGYSSNWAIASGQSLTISDTFTNVSSFLKTSMGSKLFSQGAILSVNGSPSGNVSDAISFLSLVSTSKFNQTVFIYDSGVSISSNIDALNSLVSRIGSITATSSIPITIAQITS